MVDKTIDTSPPQLHFCSIGFMSASDFQLVLGFAGHVVCDLIDCVAGTIKREINSGAIDG